jgi:hypothetical protein
MIWLVSQLFQSVAPFFDFIGDHRYALLSMLALVAAGAARLYVPVAPGALANALIALAIGLACFDWGYSHRTAIDREAWASAGAERVRVGLLERARREDAIAKARRDAESAEAALKAQQEEHAAYMREIEHASERNSVQCLDAAAGVRLDKISARRKKAR